MDNKQTFKDRLKIWIDSLNMSVSAFERKCGLGVGYVANLKDSTSSKKINDILNAFPNLNKEWLLNGEGEMMNTNITMVQNGDGGVHQQGHAGTILNQTANSEKMVLEFIDSMKLQASLTERSMAQTDKFLEEISEQRKMMDRLISMLENKIKE